MKTLVSKLTMINWQLQLSAKERKKINEGLSKIVNKQIDAECLKNKISSVKRMLSERNNKKKK